ncbi:reprolysin-like metallopeptidase [uncultured Marivirga sp.]|uniref:reprolysin-like metallopeptidase n=1 Tax=uncultured Marivirga sp. TaxID=1123707 RepID=UPI0030EF5247|tara:strand:- start:4478 stop:8542 length:4065 start_codon:yes stop_codon:yes gene_type:complete
MRLQRFLIFLIVFFTGFVSHAQNSNGQFWTESNARASARLISTEKQKIYKLAVDQLKAKLNQNSKLNFSIPYPDGAFQEFKLEESPIMAPALAKKYPNIKTYSGRNPTTGETLRLDLSKKGFHAMVYSTEGVFFIDPVQDQSNDYQIYYKKDLKRDPKKPRFEELEPIIADDVQFQRMQSMVESGNVNQPSGTQLRTYRIAVAATGEYTEFHGGTVEDGLSAIVSTMNRVNSIYEKEIAVRMVLVENNDEIIFTNSSTDPFTVDDVGILIDENQVVLDSIIGNQNYDLGHNFSTAAGGLAGLGVVCRSNSKARGVTGINQPIGDPFDVDYVSHEIGHQFGAPHTFNGTVSSCGQNRSANSAYEPGSGSTIMAYAGICGGDNIQNNSDPYFHTASLDFMNAYIQDNAGNNCADITETGNNLPIVEAGQGGFTIPISTPFQLNGFATDPDGDQLNYAWEQFDLGPAGSPNLPQDNAPLFRSFSPTLDSFRIFPQISDILNGTQTKGEILPDYARNLNFRLSVRDNQAIAAVDHDEISFSVTDIAGPFIVDTISGDYSGLNIITVSWEVNNTNIAPVNAAFVDIYLSTDGGQTFSVKVLENTENDGSEPIELPNINTNQAKIKVVASNNIFFNISPDVFTITETTEPTFTLEAEIDSDQYCPEDEITFTINITSILEYDESINLSVSDLADFEVSFDQNTLAPGESTILTITNTNQNTGEFNFTLEANTVDKSKSKELSFNVVDFPTAPNITFPVEADNNINLSPTIMWEDSNLEANYLLEIALDNNFNEKVDSVEVVNAKEYKLQENLQRLTSYFVRVKAINNCGESDFSDVISFSTADIICDLYEGTDLPLSISSENVDTIQSIINIPYSGKVESIGISNLVGTHSYINDLSFILESPTGTQITLLSNICDDQDNFNLSISDEGTSSELPCPPSDGETYQSEEALNTLNGEESEGEWKLIVIDRFAADGGELQSWSLDLCLLDVVAPEILAPTNLTANENVTGTVELSWTDNSENETSFIIERSTDNNSNFQEFADVDSNTSTYSDTDIVGQTQYFYRVKAVLDIFSSDYSNDINITTQLQVPPAPSTITASNLESGNVLIQWTDNTDLEEGYILERSQGDNTNYSNLAELEANSFDFVDETVEEESVYFYRVKGFNENGDGNYSSEVEIETLIGLPLAPTDLDFELLNDSTVRLNWADNAQNESSYRVQRSDNGNDFISVAELEVDSKSYEEILNSGNYNYRVLARNTRGNSNFSNEVTVEIDLENGVLSVRDEWKSKITLFPNPAQQIVNLKNESQYEIEKIQIRNSLGQKIRDVKFNDATELEISIQDLNSGIYFIYLETIDNVLIKQLMVK